MLEQYRQGLEKIADDCLSSYTTWIKEYYKARIPSPKEVNDPVWGTLTLSALEMLLLDSPLLQRLRRIRQLGVAHWVYPGATHTRLEHSIGALFLVQRLLQAANTNAKPDAVVPERYVLAIRVATLCHDIGHGVMSHVSENAFAYVEFAEDLRNEFTDEYGKEAALGEINAFFLVGSHAFALLLEAAQQISKRQIEVTNLVDFIQRCIVGKPVDPEYPLLHQLVSGPFDADKLDWMTRDAYMSGVPVVTDVNRLIRKVRSVRIVRDRAPLEVQKLSDTNTNTIVVLGIDRSGNRTLDELTLGRTLLFDKLYRHHKIRACEAIIAAVLTGLANAAAEAGVPWEAALMAFRLDDEALVSGAITPHLNGVSLSKDSLRLISYLTKWLRNRFLFVRALAFSRKMTGDPYDYDDEQALGLQELLAYVADPIRRREESKKIALLTETALELLGQKSVVSDWPGALQDYIWLDGVRTAEHLSASTKAMLITADQEVISFAAEAPETPQWATAYQQTRDIAFVFCPPEIAIPTALAAEKYLREEYGVRLPTSAMIAVRHSPTKGRDERLKLADKGFYKDCALDLLPLPGRLLEGDVDSRMRSVAQRLNGYLPPTIEPGRVGRDQFESGRIRDFVRQFVMDEMIDSALKILAHFEMIDRDAVVGALAKFLETRKEFQDASLVIFGTAGDSSSIATYFAMDAAHRYPNLRVQDLAKALLLNKSILFVDDIIGSGRQAAAIVRAWFGDTKLAEELGEQRQVLPQEVRSLLVTRSLGFCFAVGLDGGVDELQEALKQIGITTAQIFVDRGENGLPTIFKSGDVGEPARSRFVARCGEIGEQLLAQQTKQNQENRRLGYGNKGLLITFPYNTPSQTLTCVWERGTVNKRPWMPLLARRRKK